MDNKCINKSTIQQLRSLMNHMEENPEFARGTPVFGSTKQRAEEEWKKLCLQLNSLGPPTRTLADWKKTWADLKSMTKKKVSENKKSLLETGGGLFRFNNLTELEQVIDRTLFLSSAAAPSGIVYGLGTAISITQSIDDCFQSLVGSPPKTNKALAVINPNRIGGNPQHLLSQKLLPSQQLSISPQLLKSPQLLLTQQRESKTGLQQKATKRRQAESENEHEGNSSAKRRKSVVNEQLALIRRQIRVSDKTVATSKEQVDAIKRLADASETQTEEARRTEIAAEATAASTRSISQTASRIERLLKTFLQSSTK